jgi:hypothetical protein
VQKMLSEPPPNAVRPLRRRGTRAQWRAARLR